jgi:hypothetical protein
VNTPDNIAKTPAPMIEMTATSAKRGRSSSARHIIRHSEPSHHSRPIVPMPASNCAAWIAPLWSWK